MGFGCHLPSWARSIPESAIPALRLLASSMNSAPRLVKEMGKSLRTQWQYEGWKASICAVLSEYAEVQALFYPPVTFPAGKYLHTYRYG